MSTAHLKQQMQHTLGQISLVEQEFKTFAAKQNIDPFKLQTMQGDWPLMHILVAKANILVALTNLEK